MQTLIVPHSFCLLLALSLCCAISVKEKCTTCRDFIKKFGEGMEKTTKQNFGGGNTAWEEKSLGSFARSETRLLEILEDDVCKSASDEKYCHLMAEQYEEEIEHWWFKIHNDIASFEKYLCVGLAKVCCPFGTYGGECVACPSSNNLPCNDHGECDGNGTRAGKGSCDCQSGYTGDSCGECSDGFSKNETTAVCTDIDECAVGSSDCSEDEFCKNTAGSFECKDCPTICNSCTGEAVQSCTSCKDGYRLGEKGVGCVDVNECEEGSVTCGSGLVCQNLNGSHACVKEGPEGYEYGVDGLYFKIHTDAANWTVAKATCESEAASLAVVDSDSVFNFLTARYPTTKFWLGISDAEKEGSWVTVSGTALKGTHWHTGEPNGGEKANCAVSNWNEPGKWNDEACESLFEFLCQFEHAGEESSQSNGHAEL